MPFYLNTYMYIYIYMHIQSQVPTLVLAYTVFEFGCFRFSSAWVQTL